MALICNRHSFEYAENVCSRCGIAFCHDCLVYPRGPKKPPLCVPCAISAAGVRSSARNHSNLSRREVKKRVREAKDLQQPQPYVEAPAAANSDRDFELTSNASFDQGWAVSWDEGRDPHPGYPEPVTVTGNDPFATRDDAPRETPEVAAPPSPVVETPPELASAPARPPELPRLQPIELARGHAPARQGGLPSVRPPLKPGAADTARTPLRPPADQPPLAEKPVARPATPADAADEQATAPPAAPPSGRLRRKVKGDESTEMLGWLDDLLGTDKGP
ncbi:MAG TPA: hypothetical protein VM282_18660 [Acidimicrobiales bacterium]|nr:hypothetical protein [Acidimicrobiales bacterium]